jgi:Porin PorA
MRRATKIVALIGGFLAVATGLWLLIAPAQLVKYPSDLDKTAVTSGQVTLFIDPATATARSVPQTLPLSIKRHVYVVDSSGSQATVQEASSEKVGPLPEQTIKQRYVLDRSSLENLKSDQAYAYVPANVTDRAPFYSINLPFDTGSGPYKIWKNETGSAYSFKREGAEVKRDGVTLIPLVGSMSNAPATSAYIDQLKGQGIARSLTSQQMAAQLKAQGIDLQAISKQLLPQMSPALRKATQVLLSQAVPLKYFVSVKTRLLVEPTTGAIVSLDSIDQTLTAAPDLKGFSSLAETLSASPIAGRPAVAQAIDSLTALTKAPPVKVFEMKYGQTPSSVSDFASYAKSKADSIDLVKRTIPGILAILAAILLIAAGVMAYRDRGRPAAPSAPQTPPEPRKTYA